MPKPGSQPANNPVIRLVKAMLIFASHRFRNRIMRTPVAAMAMVIMAIAAPALIRSAERRVGSDWSSDVCSSDLVGKGNVDLRQPSFPKPHHENARGGDGDGYYGYCRSSAHWSLFPPTRRRLGGLSGRGEIRLDFSLCFDFALVLLVFESSTPDSSYAS